MNWNYIAFLGLGVILGTLFLIWSIVQVWARIENPKVKSNIEALLYQLDEQCDNMEIPAKRAQAILTLQQLLGWRRLFLPAVIIGAILDLLVRAVRKIGIPDLHKEAAENAKSGIGTHPDAG